VRAVVTPKRGLAEDLLLPKYRLGFFGEGDFSGNVKEEEVF
jgi:hypothetical protein